MGVVGGTNIRKNILWGFDTGEPVFSNNINTRYFQGRPTTNLLEGASFSSYNNVPSDVTSTLITERDSLERPITFQGAPIIKQTLTPTTSTGVSYLTSANNPGIGVVTSGGGGDANTYTGHSVFFKPTVPMHTNPIYTNYSNIGGWQTSTLHEYVGDGWYRAYVTWFNTVSGSDGKYWAINPRQAYLNEPIVIYWAGPFKESLNSTTVSPYVLSSRSTTGSLFDMSKSRTINISNVSFDSLNRIVFDGTDDTLDSGIAMSSLPATSNFTFETVFQIFNYPTTAPPNVYENVTRYGVLFGAAHYSGAAIYWAGNNTGTACDIYGFIRGTDAYRNTTPFSISTGVYYHVFMVNNYSAGTLNLYVNGSLYSSVATATQNYDSGLISTAGNIGISKPQVDGGGVGNYSYFNCEVYVAKVHNYALTPDEVMLNYTAYKNRFISYFNNEN